MGFIMAKNPINTVTRNKMSWFIRRSLQLCFHLLAVASQAAVERGSRFLQGTIPRMVVKAVIKTGRNRT